jgi:MscS family membrane protein
MKLRFNWAVRSAIFLAGAFLIWGMWARAQSGINVRLITPEDLSMYEEGADVTLSAAIGGQAIMTMGEGVITNVVFYQNNRLLHAVTNTPFQFTWTNVPSGTFSLTVVAFDRTGVSVVSDPVKIHVRAALGALTFGLDRIPVLKREVLGNPLWQYIASLIYIILAFYISKVLDLLVRLRLKIWASRTTSRLDDLLVELIHGPVKIVSFVILLHIGLRVFDWPIWVQEFLSKALIVIVAVSITYMALKLVDVLLVFWRQRAIPEADQTFNQQLFPLVRKSLKVFIVVVAFLVTSPHLGLNVTGLIASLSIGGLALGLAAQDTLGNLFGAVAIFLDKPFKVGDRIQLEAIDGVVESIGLRSTRVRNLDGHLITVPNKTMGNATITNVTLRPNIRTLMNISVTYDTPAEKVQRAVDILGEVFRGHPLTQDVWISFNKFADSSLNIFVVHWWKSTVYKDYLAGMQEMNLEIKRRFDQENINFAFPTQTLYVKQDSDFRIMQDEAKPV